MNKLVELDKKNRYDAEETSSANGKVQENGIIERPDCNWPLRHIKTMGFFEKIFIKAFLKNKVGSLIILYPVQKEMFIIEGEVNKKKKGSPAILEIRNHLFFRHTVLHGEIGFGEAYTEGYWDSPEPISVLKYIARNARTTPTFASSVSSFLGNILVNYMGYWHRIRHKLRPNTIAISRKNISEHYDLSNEFFSLMLDKTMAYSCARFTDTENLEQAQYNKFNRICEKLNLQGGEHILEIGCGWGGFAIYAAEHYGVKVTGVTISRQQYDFAIDKIKEKGLQDSVEILFQDYRHTEGQYDRIVSIEMIEAIGFQYMNTFFRKCAELLKPEGIMVIQCITFPDPHYKRYLRNTDWTQIHIFPGSDLVSQREIFQTLNRTGDLVVYGIESMGLEYGKTLRSWRENFEKNHKQVLSLGFDNTFIRKWRYYLIFCETGFDLRMINDVQIVISRSANENLLDS